MRVLYGIFQRIHTVGLYANKLYFKVCVCSSFYVCKTIVSFLITL